MKKSFLAIAFAIVCVPVVVASDVDDWLWGEFGPLINDFFDGEAPSTPVVAIEGFYIDHVTGEIVWLPAGHETIGYQYIPEDEVAFAMLTFPVSDEVAATLLAMELVEAGVIDDTDDLIIYDHGEAVPE